MAVVEFLIVVVNSLMGTGIFQIGVGYFLMGKGIFMMRVGDLILSVCNVMVGE